MTAPARPTTPVSGSGSAGGSGDAPDERATSRRGPRFARVGAEPDPRFTYANERTFLAWIRTALALVAAGLAAAQFLRVDPEGLRLAVALPLIALGALASAGSYRRWERSERALRLGQPLPYSSFMPTLAYGVAATAVLSGVLALVVLVLH